MSTANLINLISTANLANVVSTANLTGIVSTANLTSVISTANLTSLISTANLTNLVSTANFAGLVSTTFLDARLTSSLLGLGTFGFLSTGYSTLIASSFSSSNANIQFFTTSTIVFGTGTGYLTLPNSVIPNLSVGVLYVSTLVGYTPVVGATGNFVSTANLSGLVSTSFFDSRITSTVIGLGTTGYLSSIGTLIFPGGLISTANLATLVSTANLATLVSTANLATLVSTANLAGLVSTANLSHLVSTANLAGLVSTANLSDLVSSLNLSDLVSTANLSGLVSTANLSGLVSTANLVGLVSTANLVGLVSTANLVGLVSSSFFDSQITSSITGLGTVGFLSTQSIKFDKYLSGGTAPGATSITQYNNSITNSAISLTANAYYSVSASGSLNFSGIVYPVGSIYLSIGGDTTYQAQSFTNNLTYGLINFTVWNSAGYNPTFIPWSFAGMYQAQASEYLQLQCYMTDGNNDSSAQLYVNYLTATQVSPVYS